MLDVLRDHVGQAEALRHGGRRRHVSRRRHVPTRVAGAPVVVQFGPLAAGNASIRKELVGPALIRGFNAFARQALGDVQRGSRAAVMEHGKGFVAEFPAFWRRRYCWWRATRKELRALREAGGLRCEQCGTVVGRVRVAGRSIAGQRQQNGRDHAERA